MGLLDFPIGTKKTAAGIPAKRSTEVREALLAVNRPALPFIVRDGSPASQDFPISDSADFIPGNTITIAAGYNSTETQIFSGIIMQQGLNIDIEDSQLHVICSDAAIKMTVGKKNTYYNNGSSPVKDSDLMSTIIGNYSGLSANVTSTTVSHPLIYQYYSSDWDFLVARAEANGMVVTSDAGWAEAMAEVEALPVEHPDALAVRPQRRGRRRAAVERRGARSLQAVLRGGACAGAVPIGLRQCKELVVNPSSRRHRFWLAGLAAAVLAAGAGIFFVVPDRNAQANNPPAKAAAATPVSVAVVEQRDVAFWDEFSGRLEAVERVEVRSRVAGAVKSAHFREGALVKEGDLLVTIDPEPYEAEVARADAQVAAAQARVALTKNELERGKQLWDSRNVSQRDLDQRVNAQGEAEANLKAAQAALTATRLNLDYTQVRAPVAGRVGKLEITVGNLIAAGPGAPVLTTLVSVDPVYASFNADEEVVARALKALGSNAHMQVDRIPVQMVTATSNGVWKR